MNKTEKVFIAIIVLFSLLTINFIIEFTRCIDLKNQKINDNKRWKQIEERILKVEERVGDLENGRIIEIDN